MYNQLLFSCQDFHLSSGRNFQNFPQKRKTKLPDFALGMALIFIMGNFSISSQSKGVLKSFVNFLFSRQLYLLDKNATNMLQKQEVTCEKFHFPLDDAIEIHMQILGQFAQNRVDNLPHPGVTKELL